MARRNNTMHPYLLRGLVSCARCRLACSARAVHPGYHYYLCRGRTDALRKAQGERCYARYTPASKLDELVWQDLCALLRDPMLIRHELERAQAGAWLQQARLLDVYLAEVIGRDEFERKRVELDRTQRGLRQQLRELEAQAQKQLDVAQLADGIKAFCQRLGPTLDKLSFAQRRQLVELLIDRVVVEDGKVEIRYVIPTSPHGEKFTFCHLRLDYFNPKTMSVPMHSLLGQLQRRHQIHRLVVARLVPDDDMHRTIERLCDRGSRHTQVAFCHQGPQRPDSTPGRAVAHKR
jgi:site-specific DNA recombinase